MTGSVALDVAIGLVFIYSLYSLLTTTVTEIIATWFQLRSKFLVKGIRRMLDDNSGTTKFSAKFYDQPLIKYLASDNKKKPAYLSAQSFSKNLLEVLKEEGLKSLSEQDTNDSNGASAVSKIQALLDDNEGGFKESETVKFIKSLWEDAQHDLEKFKAHLEQWYDDTMERVTGWYKKRVQWITFFAGLAIAIIFNVDTLKIVDKLSKDPRAREQFVAMAQKFVEDKEVIGQIYGKDSIKAYDTLKVTLASLRKQALEANNVLSIERDKDKSGNPVYITWKGFFGWFITAIALSLGAPFWFDLLNKLMKLRSSVQTTAQSPPSSLATTDKSVPATKRVG